jgi:hypothetical protein
MSLNFFPKEIESIITDYKNHFESAEKYNKVLDELKFKINVEYHHDEENNMTYWGNTVYEQRILYELDLLIIMKDNEFYRQQCVIFDNICYYNMDDIDEIIEDLLDYEGEGYFQDIDDVDQYHFQRPHTA